MIWRKKRPDLGRRGLLPVDHTPGSVDELIQRYSSAGLQITADVSSAAAQQPVVAEILAAVLAAAHRNDIADVGFTTIAVDQRLELRATARTIDRSVAIEFARQLDLLGIRRRVEEIGGRVQRAHTRFAIFHLDIDLPLH